MAPRKRKAVDGEEEAVKADTRPTTTTRVTRSSTRKADSNSTESPKKETGKVKAKAEGKKKKTADALKAEKEAEAKRETENATEKEEEVQETKDNSAESPKKETGKVKAKAEGKKKKTADALKAEKEAEAKRETENATEKEEEVQETKEAVEGPKRTVVIEHCKQCNSFKTRAIQVKNGLEDAIPGISVEINPDKPRRGCLEIREKGGETFISLLDMKRPFQPMKALDMEKVIKEIVDKIKGSSD